MMIRDRGVHLTRMVREGRSEMRGAVAEEKQMCFSNWYASVQGGHLHDRYTLHMAKHYVHRAVGPKHGSRKLTDVCGVRSLYRVSRARLSVLELR